MFNAVSFLCKEFIYFLIFLSTKLSPFPNFLKVVGIFRNITNDKYTNSIRTDVVMLIPASNEEVVFGKNSI